MDTDAILDLIETDDSWSAANEILKDGYPIIISDEQTPKGCILKKYPDGKIEVIEVDVVNRRHKVIDVR